MQISTEYAAAEQVKEGYIVMPGIKPVAGKRQGALIINEVAGTFAELPKELAEDSFVVRIPPAASVPRHRFKVLQKFEGTVLEISGQECRALIRDLTSPGNVEEVLFSVEEISDSDRSLAVPGGIFYWYIGYDDRIGGQRYRSSAIIFRRFPFWSEKELIKSKKRAAILIEQLGWKREDTTHQR